MNIPQLCHPKYIMTGLGMTVLIFYQVMRYFPLSPCNIPNYCLNDFVFLLRPKSSQYLSMRKKHVMSHFWSYFTQCNCTMKTNSVTLCYRVLRALCYMVDVLACPMLRGKYQHFVIALFILLLDEMIDRYKLEEFTTDVLYQFTYNTLKIRLAFDLML